MSALYTQFGSCGLTQLTYGAELLRIDPNWYASGYWLYIACTSADGIMFINLDWSECRSILLSNADVALTAALYFTSLPAMHYNGAISVPKKFTYRSYSIWRPLCINVSPSPVSSMYPILQRANRV